MTEQDFKQPMLSKSLETPKEDKVLGNKPDPDTSD
jgi:hypothetical protein